MTLSWTDADHRKIEEAVDKAMDRVNELAYILKASGTDYSDFLTLSPTFMKRISEIEDIVGPPRPVAECLDLLDKYVKNWQKVLERHEAKNQEKRRALSLDYSSL